MGSEAILQAALQCCSLYWRRSRDHKHASLHQTPTYTFCKQSSLCAARYENTGLSLFLVAAMSVVLPPACAALFWLLRKVRQRCLTRCVQTASQEAYDAAWQGDEFLLDYR